jgi:peptidoglycan/LPS O-acetylase OafA/YrhL
VNETIAVDAVIKRQAYPAGSVDLLRVVSAVAIVWFHADLYIPGKSIAHGGLSVFLMLAFMFVSPPATSWDGWTRYVTKRSRRLLRPFAAWAVFYALLKMRVMKATPAEFAAAITWNDVFGGFSDHLWFLLFVFVVSALLAATRWPKASIGALVAISLLIGAQTQRPWAEWQYSIPVVLVALLVREKKLLLSGAVLCTWVVLVDARSHVADAISHSVGYIALLAVLGMQLAENKKLAALSGLTLGVYLIHPFMFSLVFKFMPGASMYARFAIGVLGAAAITALMKKIPFARELV